MSINFEFGVCIDLEFEPMGEEEDWEREEKTIKDRSLDEDVGEQRKDVHPSVVALNRNIGKMIG